MRFEHDLTLRDYLASADETTRDLLSEPNEFVAAAALADKLFAEDLWAGDIDLPPVPALLALDAYMVLLSAIRTAMSGHERAIYPLLRTALESGCYVHRMVQEPDLQDVWLNRHSSEQAYKLCRRRFSSAVADTAKSIGRREASYGQMIMDAYDAAIDFGGHPNLRSVLLHTSFSVDERAAFQGVQLVSLYGADSAQVKRALVACLDYALAIGLVLIHSLPAASSKGVAALDDLNSAKLRLAASIQAET